MRNPTKHVPGRAMTVLVVVLMLLGAFAWGRSTVFAHSTASRHTPARRYVIAFVPKLINIGYFNAMQRGGNLAAEQLGVVFDYEGPATADAALQVKIIKRLIARRVDAIAVAPDDPAVVAPVMKQAEARGIKVFTSDTDAPGTGRRVFVNQATAPDVGNAVMDTLAMAMGNRGEFAIDSCGPAAHNLNSWIAIEKKRAAEKYPRMTLVATVYSGEDFARAVKDSKALISAHPKLRGIIGQCTPSAPGAGKAITDAHKIGKIFGGGVSIPSLMKPYIRNGASPRFVIWDPVKLGYLTVWAGLQLAKGTGFKAVNHVPYAGTIKYLAGQKMLLLGKPLIIDKHNIDTYHF